MGALVVCTAIFSVEEETYDSIDRWYLPCSDRLRMVFYVLVVEYTWRTTFACLPARLLASLGCTAILSPQEQQSGIAQKKSNKLGARDSACRTSPILCD
ncbi:hypothetical protein IG631_11235 [Alternaria alternata]|nr:hypothetical protein IG631_11235 [Alternaria alternata]